MEKPYNPAELIARVKAHLRRYHAWGGAAPKNDSDTLVNGGLVLDKKRRLILVEGEEVRLTATEYKILELLMGLCCRCFQQNRFMKMYGKNRQIIRWKIQ